jgi:hypothetical protein
MDRTYSATSLSDVAPHTILKKIANARIIPHIPSIIEKNVFVF